MIVFDASTLILLAKVEALDLFLDDYKSKAVLPKEAEREVTAKKTFDGLFIRKRITEGKIKVVEAPEEMAAKLAEDFRLTKGEAEAVAVAANDKNIVLATDDKNAINACKVLNIKFTTAVDFVVRAKEKNLLTKEEALSKVSELARYERYKQTIIENAESRIRSGENAKDSKRKD